MGDRPSLRSSCSGREAVARPEWACRQQRLINHHLQQQEAAAPDAALPGDQLSADQKLEFFEFCIIALPTLCYILPL